MTSKTLSTVGLFCLLATSAATPAFSADPGTKPFSIEAKPLASALMDFGAQCDEVIVAPTDLVGDKVAREVHGAMSPERALRKLLEGSGLSWRRGEDGSIAIIRSPAQSQASRGLMPIRLAAADTAAAPRAAAEPSGPQLEEVLVTAGKRGAERLQDVPVSITAISQERIERSGMDDFLDYARAVPGLGFQMLSAAGGRDDIRGGRRLNLRGIESGFDGVPTVAFYLDEAPVPVMDPKLFDIERIEVLRGPQGTLYGANSMGGAIRIVLNKPVLNDVDYRADASLKSTRFGSESYDFNGMVNIPVVEDKLAVRGVVFYRDQGGVIDNFLDSDVRQKDTDGEESWGARFAATWQVTDDLRITPSVFHQDTKVKGSATWDSAFRDLSSFNRRVRDRQATNFTLTSLDINWSLGLFNVSSATSYFDTDFDTVEDVSKGWWNLDLIPIDQVQLSLVKTRSRRLSEEFRVSYTGERWNGVVGAFFLDEDRFFDQFYPRADGSTEEPSIFAGTQGNGEKQTALFTEGSFKLTDPLELTAGVRWFRGEQDQHVRFFSDGVLDAQDGDSSESAFSPKVQLSYHIDPDKMTYVSATKGFRPGGATGVIPLEPCQADLAALGLTEAPSEYESDSLWSYEVGSKLRFADNRAVIDAAVYYIDWTDVQQTVLLADCGFTFLGNVGKARSRGFEIEASFKPTESLSLNGSLGSTDAEFTKSNEAIGILAGDRLPLVPRWTAAAGAQYTFALPTGHAAYVLGDYQFQDKVLNGYGSHFQKSYGTVNARVGVALSERSELTLFADNLTDERPQLFYFEYDPGFLPPQNTQDMITARPRTIGISYRYRR